MTNILAVTSSAAGEASVSSRLAKAFATHLRAITPEVSLTWRDVDLDPPPHLTVATLGALQGAPLANDAERASRALSDRLIAELMAADVLLIASPMYNLGITSTLKAWFDHVLRAGTTFRYTAQGPEGLVVGKPAVVIETRGGVYSQGPMVALDAQEPHLRAMLGLMGFTEIACVRAEGLGLDSIRRTAAIEAATTALRRLAEALAAAPVQR